MAEDDRDHSRSQAAERRSRQPLSPERDARVAGVSSKAAARAILQRRAAFRSGPRRQQQAHARQLAHRWSADRFGPADEKFRQHYKRRRVLRRKSFQQRAARREKGSVAAQRSASVEDDNR